MVTRRIAFAYRNGKFYFNYNGNHMDLITKMSLLTNPPFQGSLSVTTDEAMNILYIDDVNQLVTAVLAKRYLATPTDPVTTFAALKAAAILKFPKINSYTWTNVTANPAHSDQPAGVPLINNGTSPGYGPYPGT